MAGCAAVRRSAFKKGIDLPPCSQDSPDAAASLAERIARELRLAKAQVRTVVALLDAEATPAFIARYRKEATGGLDETAIFAIRDRAARLRALDRRREAILKSLRSLGKLDDALRIKIDAAESLAALEDLYLPYRPKRRTRAMAARERRLEPLARRIFEQGPLDPEAEAAAFVSADKGVASVDDALAGARDIMAEWMNEDADARAELRALFSEKAVMKSRVVEGMEEKGAKFRDYFDWSQPLATAPAHRVLAARRGAEQGVLTITVRPDEQEAIDLLTRRFVKDDGPAGEQVRQAAEDAYKRLLAPSLETEARRASKRRADEESVNVFAENLRALLMAPPLGQKAVIGIDPGLRTGCKVVCLDPQGKLLHHETLFPLEPRSEREAAADALKRMAEQFQIEAIAVGNGTGGRDAYAFCRSIEFGRPMIVEMVNESGASVYSASEAAREEFPDLDVTVRGAVSIGRRLMDPLAELVKIDPKSIGVGQYQHDVDQRLLKQRLEDVVMSCVNQVGVDVNTASEQLLSYVSGLGPALARRLVEYRDAHGSFRSRRELLNAPGMGPKTFEQAAGFLRIRGGENPLDASAVHPESYPIVEQMASDLGCTVAELMRDASLRRRIDLKRYVTEQVGEPTLTDILNELAAPGRDPRRKFEPFSFAEEVREFGDLKPGMRLPGVVTNVTDFGAFVDVGVHHDGLLHVSEVSDGYVRRASDVLKAGQRVTVTVVSVDMERRRVSLSMRAGAAGPGKPAGRGAGARGAARRKAASRTRGQSARSPRGARTRGPARESVGGRRPLRNNPFVEFFRNHPIGRRRGES